MQISNVVFFFLILCVIVNTLCIYVGSQFPSAQCDAVQHKTLSSTDIFGFYISLIIFLHLCLGLIHPQKKKLGLSTGNRQEAKFTQKHEGMLAFPASPMSPTHSPASGHLIRNLLNEHLQWHITLHFDQRPSHRQTCVSFREGNLFMLFSQLELAQWKLIIPVVVKSKKDILHQKQQIDLT